MTNITSPTTGSSAGAPPGDKISVLLVDDSSVIRGALGRIIDNDPDIVVAGSVANGEFAVSSATKHQPDIVILDIEMPVKDGLSALPDILKVSPNSKVIMFSALTEKGATVTLKAFQLGAVECFVKPSSAQDVGPGSEFQQNFLSTIKGLVPEKVGKFSRAPASRKSTPTTQTEKSAEPQAYSLKPDSIATYKGKPALIAIGSSTGGPQALFEVISNLKGINIPIVITQHMPATFTKILAQHITQHTGTEAYEGAEGMPIQPGKAIVAPGGFHMNLVKKDGRIVVSLDDGPPVNFCKPAVDPMFNSAVDIFGNKVLGVILTGMGHDGLGGGKKLTEAGGRLIAQDEASSVVWGMPGAVARAGICSQVLPLKDIGPWVLKAVTG